MKDYATKTRLNPVNVSTAVLTALNSAMDIPNKVVRREWIPFLREQGYSFDKGRNAFVYAPSEDFLFKKRMMEKI